MKRLPFDTIQVIQLLVGLVLLAIGIYLTKLSTFGMAPWGVFHAGVSEVTGISFGFVTQLVGVIILVFSILLFHTKIGIGTVLNIIIVGPLIVFFEELYMVHPTTNGMQIMIFGMGFLTLSFGRSLYIASRLGQGPRDGFFVGMARTLPFEVRTIKFTVEFVVFATGVVLLALKNPEMLFDAVGIGTALVVVLSGFLVQWYFTLLLFHPKRFNPPFIV